MNIFINLSFLNLEIQFAINLVLLETSCITAFKKNLLFYVVRFGEEHVIVGPYLFCIFTIFFNLFYS